MQYSVSYFLRSAAGEQTTSLYKFSSIFPLRHVNIFNLCTVSDFIRKVFSFVLEPNRSRIGIDSTGRSSKLLDGIAVCGLRGEQSVSWCEA